METDRQTDRQTDIYKDITWVYSFSVDELWTMNYEQFNWYKKTTSTQRYTTLTCVETKISEIRLHYIGCKHKTQWKKNKKKQKKTVNCNLTRVESDIARVKSGWCTSSLFALCERILSTVQPVSSRCNLRPSWHHSAHPPLSVTSRNWRTAMPMSRSLRAKQ